MQTSQPQFQGSQMEQSGQNSQTAQPNQPANNGRWDPKKWSKAASCGAAALIIVAAIVNFITLKLNVRIVILSIHYM